MAPQRGRPYGANLGSMGRNTGLELTVSAISPLGPEEKVSKLTTRPKRTHDRVGKTPEAHPGQVDGKTLSV